MAVFSTRASLRTTLGEEQGERHQQDINTMDEGYQCLWDRFMMSDYS